MPFRRSSFSPSTLLQPRNASMSNHQPTMFAIRARTRKSNSISKNHINFRCQKTNPQEASGTCFYEKALRFFFCPSPSPFGGSAVLSLTRGPAGNRTTTGSLSATSRTPRYQMSHEDDSMKRRFEAWRDLSEATPRHKIRAATRRKARLVLFKLHSLLPYCHQKLTM